MFRFTIRDVLWFTVVVAAGSLLARNPLAQAQSGDVYSAEERSHWSLQPRSQPMLPAFAEERDAAWLANPVDAFVLRRLRDAGFMPASPADCRTLIHRLSFNLTGLPPSPEAIEQFENDPAPDAYERLIDRLLANPHYGEA